MEKNYTSDQISEMANNLYLVKAILDVLSYAGETTSDINGDSISAVAREAREKVSRVLKILNP